jgi:pimeloyl-ACP methyl ester carboxylesterase
MEDVILFQNTKGKKLFGIVNIPKFSLHSEGRKGVIILNPGIKYRVAPNRLNVKLARELCDRGYYVFRFDPEGIGDSEGELPENTPVADLWGQIQKGRFVNDAIEANTYFMETWKLDQLVLIGNCGGAITALMTAAQDPRVDSLCLIDIPVFQWGSETSAADIIVGGQQTDNRFSEYVSNIFKPHYWYKLITLNADFKTFGRVVKVKLQNLLLPKERYKFDTNLEELCREKKLNIKFFQSVGEVMSRNKTMLFVSAGNDPGRETFETYFQNNYLSQKYGVISSQGLIDIFLIKNANHIYSLSESQDALFNRIFTWLPAQSAK